jgi:hypothetical protein
LIDKDTGFIKFSSVRSRPSSSPLLLNSLEGVIDFNSRSANDFNGFIFISNGIYRLDNFVELLDIGYQHAHTYVPHFMMLAAYMANGGKAAIIDRSIVDYVVPKVGYSYGMVAGLGVGGQKSLMPALDSHYSRRFLALFFPHNDFKVIIDLYFHCKAAGARAAYSYHTGNYLHLATVARGKIQLLAVHLLALFGCCPTLFEAALLLIARVSPRVNRHLREIRRRYELDHGTNRDT